MRRDPAPLSVLVEGFSLEASVPPLLFPSRQREALHRWPVRSGGLALEVASTAQSPGGQAEQPGIGLGYVWEACARHRGRFCDLDARGAEKYSLQLDVDVGGRDRRCRGRRS